jgi:hypothetical protein
MMMMMMMMMGVVSAKDVGYENPWLKYTYSDYARDFNRSYDIERKVVFEGNLEKIRLQNEA